MRVCVYASVYSHTAEAQHAGGDAGEDEGGRTTEEEDHGVGVDAAETGGRAQHRDPGPAGRGEGQAGGGEVRTTSRQRRALKSSVCFWEDMLTVLFWCYEQFLRSFWVCSTATGVGDFKEKKLVSQSNNFSI